MLSWVNQDLLWTMSSSRVGEEGTGDRDLEGRTVSMEDIEDIVVEGKTAGPNIPIIHVIKYSIT